MSLKIILLHKKIKEIKKEKQIKKTFNNQHKIKKI